MYPHALSYSYVAASALAVYDYLLTISDETRLVWRRKFSATAVLFVVIRYGSLLICLISLLLVNLNPAASETYAFEVLYFVIGFLVQVALAVLSALRIYAIWGMDVRPASLVLLLGIANPFITLVIAVLFFEHFNPNDFAVSTLVFYIQPGVSLLADTVVIVLTLIKTIQIQHTVWRYKVKATLSFLLLRDGTFYYVAVMFSRMSGLTVSVNVNGQYPMVFLDAVVMIMTSRFLFNLREVYLKDDQDDTPFMQPSLISSPRFATRAAGNLGAPLSTEAWTVWDDEETEEPQYTNNPLAAGLFDTELGHEGRTSTSAA